jgi:predicted nucleotidyltransferase
MIMKDERPKADDPELVALCRRHKVRRLDLFGSAANDTFDPARSDLDFLVEFDEALKSGGYFDVYFRLREELIALYGREVDLVTVPSLKNPYLRKQVMAERQLLFEAS